MRRAGPSTRPGLAVGRGNNDSSGCGLAEPSDAETTVPARPAGADTAVLAGALAVVYFFSGQFVAIAASDAGSPEIFFVRPFLETPPLRVEVYGMFIICWVLDIPLVTVLDLS